MSNIYGSIHNHDDGSNFRLKDSNLQLKDFVNTAHKKGINFLGLTNHETLAHHPEFIDLCVDKNIKPVLGNEIYLVDRQEHDKLKNNNEKIKYFHFILLAKNNKGHECLRRLSSDAWLGMYVYRGLERVPTFKDTLERYLSMPEYKGTLMASTACLGGELATLILEDKKHEAIEFIRWCQGLFGEDDFYLEIQPSDNEEQTKVNTALLKIASHYNIKYIITTDTHYATKEDKKEFSIYLHSQEGDREVDEFYSTTYLMDKEELLEFFSQDIINTSNLTYEEMSKKVEGYSFKHSPTLPPIDIPKGWDTNYVSIFTGKLNLPYIHKYLTSPYEEDRYYLKLIEDGMKRTNKMTQNYIDRVELECRHMWNLSEALQQRMSKYHVGTAQQIDIMWEEGDSLVGPGRGSAACYVVNYFLDIVQVDALEWDLPYYRYLHESKIELGDIDVDSQADKRSKILEAFKKHYGEDRVVSVGTYGTEGTKSIIISCCKSLNVDDDIASNLSGLVPVIRGQAHTISQLLFGDEEEEIEPNKEFIKIVDSIEGMREALLKNAKVIKSRGVHASAVGILPEPYWTRYPIMRSKSGQIITQYDAKTCEKCGFVKQDALTITSLDYIRVAFDKLLEDGKIKWQGSLRKTWNHYFHPDKLDLTNPRLFEILYNREMSNAFQFNTAVGLGALNKLKAERFLDVVIGNSLMRLQPTEVGSPMDRYVAFKKDITLWYKEMEEYGLTQKEIEKAKELYGKSYGVLAEQEGLMDTGIQLCGYTVAETNKLRKAVSKKDPIAQEEQKAKFFERGQKQGWRLLFLQYIWDYEIAFSLGYAFSSPHVICYSMILFQELNLFLKYGKVYWDYAGLMVDSGMLGEKEKNNNYDKLSKAIGELTNVLSPDINKSTYTFNIIDENILYSLKAIAGLDKDSLPKIIENAPYASFKDFLERIYDTGILKEKKIAILIKSGCFDTFCKDRRKVAMKFIEYIIPRKAPTMTQLPWIKKLLGQYKSLLELVEYRGQIIGKNKTMNAQIEKTFLEKYVNYVRYDFVDGKLKIDEKSFDSYYKKEIKPLQTFMKSDYIIDEYTRAKRNSKWFELFRGNTSAWEFSTLYTYFLPHELDLMPINNYYTLSNFNELEAIPTPIRYRKWNRKIKDKEGRVIGQEEVETPIYDTCTIAGTVISKDNTKGYVHLLTQYGVVSIKMQKGAYAYYNAKYENDPSWFERGTILVVKGYRSYTDFIAKAYGKGSHTICKVLSYNKEKIIFKAQKDSE